MSYTILFFFVLFFGVFFFLTTVFRFFFLSFAKILHSFFILFSLTQIKSFKGCIIALHHMVQSNSTWPLMQNGYSAHSILSLSIGNLDLIEKVGNCQVRQNLALFCN